MKKSIYSVAICFLSLFNYAYSNNDSLLRVINDKSVSDTARVKSLLRLASNCFGLGMDSQAEKYALKADSFSTAISYKRGMAFSKALLGGLLIDNDINRSLMYAHKSMDIYIQINDTVCDAYLRNLYNISLSYTRLGLYDKAYDTQIKLLNISKKTNKHFHSISANVSLGEIFKQKNNFEKALFYYNNAIKMVDKIDTPIHYPVIFNGMADVYKNIDLNKALYYQKRSLNIFLTQEDIVPIYQNYLSIAEIYRLKKQYDSTTKYINKVLSFKQLDENTKSNVYINLAEINLHQKKYNEAYKNFNISLKINNSIGLKNDLPKIYKRLYELDSITGNYQSALQHHKLYVAYKDSLDNIEFEKKVLANELNKGFESQKAIMKAEQDNMKKLSEVNRKRQRDIIIGIAIILFIMIIVSIIIYKGYLKQNKANKIISYQKHLVDEKQKEILDNITYAKRIQTSIIPTNEYISKYAKNSFVMYNPKDIVSGDFYWATEKENKFYLATADCTGHGVSGAMVSMLNSSILNEVINQNNITNTGEILNEVRNKVIKSLNPNGNEGVNDGMDCVLCAFDFDKKTLQYSASNNSFYIVRNNELIVCKADKMPIGLSTKMDSFTTNEIQLQDKDVVYMFTDGYADQFGGEQNKKFKYKQLEQLLLSIQDFTMATQKRLLIERFNEWKGNNEQTDDVLVIGVKI